MLNLLVFLLSPFFALAGATNVVTTPLQPQSSNVQYATGGSCWNLEKDAKLTVAREMLDPVYNQFPSQPPCYGSGVAFNSPEGVLGDYTLVRRDTRLIKFKTDTEGGPYYGGCDLSGSAIRWIGNLPDGRKLWWADRSYASGKLFDFVYVETGEENSDQNPGTDADQSARIFDIYAKDTIIDDPAAYGYGHVLECNIKGGIVPVLEENADLLPPQFISFTNDGKRPYIDITGFEDNYKRFATLADVTQKPGTIGPTIPPTARLFPPFKDYIVKIEEDTLPAKAAKNGRIGTVRAKSQGKSYEYEAYFHAGEFYIREPEENVTYIYESNKGVPPSSVVRNPSLQLSVLNFRVSNEWSPYTPSCKPAIYLYPEKPTELSVQVIPDGYLTDTSPFSSDGIWEVLANPDGSLTRLDLVRGPNETYPYLYYEAQIRNLSVPKEGWVVERSKIKNQISKILFQLGLNEKETADFLSYWVPKLNDKPYYFVTLVSQDELNRKETLLFSQKPDTMIRVRMVFEGLNNQVFVPPLLLPQTPRREGFTVVDWGGGVVGGNCEEGKASQIEIK